MHFMKAASGVCMVLSLLSCHICLPFAVPASYTAETTSFVAKTNLVSVQSGKQPLCPASKEKQLEVVEDGAENKDK